jgi:hypothetical protein
MSKPLPIKSSWLTHGHYDEKTKLCTVTMRQAVIQMFDAYTRSTPDALGFGDWLLDVHLPTDHAARRIALEEALVDTALAYAEARSAKTEWQKAYQPEFDSETPEELERAINHTHVLMMIVANELLEVR